MTGDARSARVGGSDILEIKKRIDWEAVRKVVCDHHFRGRSAKHCPDCQDRKVCFRMIDDVFAFLDQLHSGQDNMKL